MHTLATIHSYDDNEQVGSIQWQEGSAVQIVLCKTTTRTWLQDLLSDVAVINREIASGIPLLDTKLRGVKVEVEIQNECAYCTERVIAALNYAIRNRSCGRAYVRRSSSGK